MATSMAKSLFNKAAVLSVELAPGLTKEVIRAGTGAQPARGAEVHAHYTGKLLDGTTFDSSHKRNRPFVFKIGLGMVIKGWDVGIASMSVGEVAVLTCDPAHGYGAAGAGGVIPPNATLAFEVELLSVGGPPEAGAGCVVK